MSGDWKKNFQKRFESRILYDTASSGCWYWSGTIATNGYGRLSRGRGMSSVSAHVVSYVYVNGPVPEGLELDHLCRNRSCVNPNHLEPVTRRENLARSPLVAAQSEVLASVHRSKTHCPHGHPYSGKNLRMINRNGKLRRRCGTCTNIYLNKWYHRKRQRVLRKKN